MLKTSFIEFNKQANYENLNIDSIVVSAHQTQCRNKKRGGVNELTHQDVGVHTSKIHTIVNGLGNSLYFKLSDGQVADVNLAVDVLKQVSLTNSNVIDDSAYGSADI
ncbi:hypothetical protein TEHD86_1707 [Tetragenococcus halophilus subsp. halophilus]|uniref:transposase n=1 Tax=Tetragenococcus halophilus TaxID=51669 RepID=UPI000CBA6161|nr:transposase [Tetragenococcus halophilus]GBD82985.1 hypothetical protein TEHD86_1707 [Tetragenococcus halophilus subsp. halophilus]